MIYPVKVLVVGTDGMLGSSILENLGSDLSFKIFCTTRRNTVDKILFDPFVHSVNDLIEKTQPKYIINCLRASRDSNTLLLRDSLHQYRINVEFQKKLMRAASANNVFAIQIATDGVFNGRDGFYNEESIKNSYSIYGRSKIIGEKYSDNTLFLRASILGIDKRPKNYSLLSWVLSHSKNTDIYGFINHYWNGVTTSAFSHIIAGLMKNDYSEPGFRHLVPSDSLSKFELIKKISEIFNRNDLNVIPRYGNRRIDRRLITNFPEWNQNVWLTAGLDKVLSIDEMLRDLASTESNQ